MDRHQTRRSGRLDSPPGRHGASLLADSRASESTCAVSFGIASGIGGLAGALLHVWLHSFILGYILAALLVFAGLMQLTGLASKMRFGRHGAWAAGTLSGIFGGLVGNQGGIRSAALLAFDLSRDSFVATATAIALLVDFFRMPVYAVTESRHIAASWPFLVTGIVGVMIGTLAGKSVLGRIPETLFRQIVAVLVLGLGIWMFIRPGS